MENVYAAHARALQAGYQMQSFLEAARKFAALERFEQVVRFQVAPQDRELWSVLPAAAAAILVAAGLLSGGVAAVAVPLIYPRFGAMAPDPLPDWLDSGSVAQVVVLLLPTIAATVLAPLAWFAIRHVALQNDSLKEAPQWVLAVTQRAQDAVKDGLSLDPGGSYLQAYASYADASNQLLAAVREDAKAIRLLRSGLQGLEQRVEEATSSLLNALPAEMRPEAGGGVPHVLVSYGNCDQASSEAELNTILNGTAQVSLVGSVETGTATQLVEKYGSDAALAGMVASQRTMEDVAQSFLEGAAKIDGQNWLERAELLKAQHAAGFALQQEFIDNYKKKANVLAGVDSCEKILRDYRRELENLQTAFLLPKGPGATTTTSRIRTFIVKSRGGR